MEQVLFDQGSKHALSYNYDCLLFDLDDTLYPYSSGIAAHCMKHIQEYMIHQLGIEESKVPDMCYKLYKYYGTTMSGLRAIGYELDYDHFHSLVHGKLPYDHLLKPDLALRNKLLSLPIQKVIFTNADKRHTSEVLKRLELEDCFESIICFETLNPTNIDGGDEMKASNDHSGIFDILEYQPSSGVILPETPVVCKPFELAFEQAFKIAKIDPTRTLFFDDSVQNVSMGKSLGLRTVLVGKSEVVPRKAETSMSMSARHFNKSRWTLNNREPGMLGHSHKIRSSQFMPSNLPSLCPHI
ncbi:suppressor of disruption of TFIIS-like [Silene latifolia]|uniref:suppressor of disruption of TFIIS-like n=1 Tax=Silene latifolia TaxID=37657 RepID=UPI003D77AA67